VLPGLLPLVRRLLPLVRRLLPLVRRLLFAGSALLRGWHREGVGAL
jgi:hypothetical protein